jgi:enoyl-CoA hydratase/carnithine racemase
LSDLLYDVRDRVATITLNRPAQRNAFTIDMVDAWADRLREAQADPDVHVIVVTGAAGAFCSGIDLSWLEEDHAPIDRKRTLAEHVHRVPLELENVDKPVIASMNGVAVGAGLDMALMCDLRLAARSARMAESYVKVGLVPGDGGCFLLPRLIGLPRALELLLTGDMVDAERAAELGMINSVHDDDQLDAAVADLAARLAAGPPIALRMIKRTTYQSLRTDLRTSLDLVSSHLALNRTTHDSLEAFHAFQERRAPRFEGR